MPIEKFDGFGTIACRFLPKLLALKIALDEAGIGCAVEARLGFVPSADDRRYYELRSRAGARMDQTFCVTAFKDGQICVIFINDQSPFERHASVGDALAAIRGRYIPKEREP
jgi:hypothetical protein